MSYNCEDNNQMLYCNNCEFAKGQKNHTCEECKIPYVYFVTEFPGVEIVSSE